MRAFVAAASVALAARTVRKLEADMPDRIANADNSVNGMVLESVYTIGLRHPEGSRSLEDFEPFVTRHAMKKDHFRRKLQATQEKRRLSGYFPNPTPTAKSIPNGMQSGDRRTQVLALSHMNSMVYPLRNVTNWKYPASATDAEGYGTEMLAHPDGMIIGDWENAQTGLEWQLSAGEEQKQFMDRLRAAYHNPTDASAPSTFEAPLKSPSNRTNDFTLGLTYGVYRDATNTVIVFRGTDDGSDFANLMLYLEGWILQKQGHQLIDMWVNDLGLEITPAIAKRKAESDKVDMKWRLIMHALVTVFKTQQNKKWYDEFGKDGLEYMINGFWPLTKEVVTDIIGSDDYSAGSAKKLWITGHSQGGTRAQWASMWLRTQQNIVADTVTFGAVGYQCAVRQNLPKMYEDDMNVRMTYDNIIDFVNVLDHSARADWGLGKTCWLGVDAAKDVNSAVHQYSERLVGYGGAELLMSGLLLRQPQRIKHIHYTHMEWAIQSLLERELTADGTGVEGGHCFQNQVMTSDEVSEKCAACRGSRCAYKLAYHGMFGTPHSRLGQPSVEGDVIVENADAAASLHPCLHAGDETPSLFSWLDLTRTKEGSTLDLSQSGAYQWCKYLGSSSYMMYGFQEMQEGAVTTEMINVAFYYTAMWGLVNVDRRGSVAIRTEENGDVNLGLIWGDFDENTFDEVVAGNDPVSGWTYSTTLKSGEKKCMSDTLPESFNVCSANVPDETTGGRRLLAAGSDATTSSIIFAMGSSSWGQVKLGTVSSNGDATFSVESSDADLSGLSTAADPVNTVVLTDAVRLGARLTVVPNPAPTNSTALGSFNDIRAHFSTSALVADTLIESAKAASGSPGAVILGTTDLSSNDKNADGSYEVLVQLLVGTESAAASEVMRADLKKEAAATSFRTELAKASFPKMTSLTLNGLVVLHKPSLSMTFNMKIPKTVDPENNTLKNQAKYAICSALDKSAGYKVFATVSACQNEVKNVHIRRVGAPVGDDQLVTLDASMELASASTMNDVHARVGTTAFTTTLNTELEAALTSGYVDDSLDASSFSRTGFTGLEPATEATTAHQDDGLSDGAVAAVIIACMVMVFLSGAGAMYFWKKAGADKPLTDIAETQNV